MLIGIITNIRIIRRSRYLTMYDKNIDVRKIRPRRVRFGVSYGVREYGIISRNLGRVKPTNKNQFVHGATRAGLAIESGNLSSQNKRVSLLHGVKVRAIAYPDQTLIQEKISVCCDSCTVILEGKKKRGKKNNRFIHDDTNKRPPEKSPFFKKPRNESDSVIRR